MAKDDFTTIDDVPELPDVPEEGKGKAKKKSKTTSRRKKSDEMTDAELRTGFYYFFKMYCMLRKSTAVFDEKEFTDLAKSYLHLSNRFPVLKYAFILMAPLATIGELLAKFKKAEDAAPKKPKKPKNVVDMNQVPGEPGVYAQNSTS